MRFFLFFSARCPKFDFYLFLVYLRRWSTPAGSDGLSLSPLCVCLPESPRSFPLSLSLRDVVFWSLFAVEADLEETLGIQVDAGVAPESPRGGGAAPRSHADGIGG